MSRHLGFARLPAIAVAAVLLLASPALLRAEDDLARAKRLLQAGHYSEAREAFSRPAKQDPIAAAVGAARCHDAVGAADDAVRILAAAALEHSDRAEPQAELGRIEFERGNYDAAQKHVDAALAIESDAPAARYFAAELHRVHGRLDEANEAYRWLVRYYNREQDRITDPEVLRWIGLGGAQFARWNRNSGQFHFLVNTLYPDAAKRDSSYWQAHLEAARLFTEKYNRGDANDALRAAISINPNAAEVHAARALLAIQRADFDSARTSIDRALAINPRLVQAHQLQADVETVTQGPRGAVAILEAARALNPVDEETLGRLAAVYGAIDGLGSRDSTTRKGTLVAGVTRRNPHCGAFFAAMGATLELLRKYPHAADSYEEAQRRMPQLIEVPGRIGLVHMRLGEEKVARKELTEAFDIDPFNIRVKNSLEVLEVLDDYGTLESDHFVIRFDRSRDSLLARHASRYLEDEVYPEITKALDFRPPGKSLIEIFSSAKRSSGHSWFSARMVGLPFIGTIGACAGKMLAIASPNDGAKFNWARVLRHEFVHIVNLQQTDFNIPHWYTEALAVRNEGPGRPDSWDQVLARRAAAGKLFNLDTINMGFIRPTSGDDWTLAYYQATLYAEYMAKTYGDAAPGKMVASYAENLDTPAALKRCFGVSEAAFEKGYRAYVDGIVAASGPSPEAPPAHDLATLERATHGNPRNAEAMARYARALLQTGRAFEARDSARVALTLDPKQQNAAFTVARGQVSTGEKSQALELLRGAVDRAAPDVEALALLADLTFDAKDYAEAERLYLLGEVRFPRAADWPRALVRVYRQAGKTQELTERLVRLAAGNADDFDIRLELARLAMDHKDFDAGAHWSRDALHIDVMSPDAHAALAQAYAAVGRHREAVDEFEVAMALKPDKIDWKLALATECIAAGMKGRARTVLEEIVAHDAENTQAKEMLRSLGR